MPLDILASFLAQAEATATPIVVHVPDGMDTSDKLLTMLIGALVSLGVGLGVALLGRNWTHGDRAADRTHHAIEKVEDATGREVHHVEREADLVGGANNREMDRVWQTLARIETAQATGLARLEANQSAGMNRVEATQSDIQKALLRLEVDQAAIKAYVESEKELRRMLGASRTGVS